MPKNEKDYTKSFWFFPDGCRVWSFFLSEPTFGLVDPLPDLVLEAAVVVGGGKFSTSDILIFSEINQNIVVDFKHKCYAGYQA